MKCGAQNFERENVDSRTMFPYGHGCVAHIIDFDGVIGGGKIEAFRPQQDEMIRTRILLSPR